MFRPSTPDLMSLKQIKFERMTNQGSLGGIDALLGCPLHLPYSKYFTATGWQSLSGKQKQIICLCLYYGINFIRELLNAFCTQVAGEFNSTSQATKKDITSKLLKRLRNLVYLESLLNHCIKRQPVSLPQLHPLTKHCVSSLISQPEVNGPKTTQATMPPNKRKRKKNLSSVTANAEDRGQPTLFDVLRKAGKIPKGAK